MKGSELKVEVILNTSYGGFSIDTEMALWLMEHRGWTTDQDTRKAYHEKDSWPVNCLVEYGRDHYSHPRSDAFEFRANRDLVDCVKALKLLHEDDPFPQERHSHLHDLDVIEVTVELGIQDYHDGKERVTSHVVAETGGYYG